MLIVKRTIERKMTEEGKAKLSSLVRTNDFTLSTRGEEKRKVFKFSKAKFAEMGLADNAILVGQGDGENGSKKGVGYILVVPIDTPDAVLKGTRGKIKNQEFTYSDLVEILNPTEDRHGYNLVEDKSQTVEGVISIWEIVPTELVRNSKSNDKDEDEGKDEPALYDATVPVLEDEIEDEIEDEETWE